MPTLKLKRAVCCAAFKIGARVYKNVIEYDFASILVLGFGLFIFSIVIKISTFLE
jgi:hypothetical protein